MDFYNKREGWRRVLDDYPTEIVMVEKIDSAYGELKNKPDWINIYNGNLCGIFVKKIKTCTMNLHRIII